MPSPLASILPGLHSARRRIAPLPSLTLSFACFGLAAAVLGCHPTSARNRQGATEKPPAPTAVELDPKAAIAELDRIGPTAKTDREALHRLVRAARDRRQAVATRAAYWLGQVGPRAVPTLIRVLADTSTEARLSACHALGLVGVQARPAIPALTRELAGESDSVASMADWALTQILGDHPTAMVEQLHELRYGTPAHQSVAASKLALLGEGATLAIPLLVRSLGDSEGSVAASAGNALARIGAPAVPALQATLGGGNPLLRSRAILVLSRIQPRSQF